jgi:hypothetical protein
MTEEQYTDAKLASLTVLEQHAAAIAAELRNLQDMPEYVPVPDAGPTNYRNILPDVKKSNLLIARYNAWNHATRDLRILLAGLQADPNQAALFKQWVTAAMRSEM